MRGCRLEVTGWEAENPADIGGVSCCNDGVSGGEFS